MVGMRPLHLLAAVAFAGGSWFSWEIRESLTLWQLAVPPDMMVAIVYAAPILGMLFVNPASVMQLGCSVISRAYRAIRQIKNDKAA